jgi:hypothetical protein
MDALSSGEGEEPVTALFIPGWSETDGTECAGVHVVGVFLMSLNVGTEFGANMFDVIQLLSGE